MVQVWENKPMTTLAEAKYNTGYLGRESEHAKRGEDTPLIMAARGGAEQVAVARLLLDAGARVDAVNAEGQTALMVCFADGRGSLEMASLLLDAGARTDPAEPYSGWTALHHAIRKQTASVASLERLLAAGVNVEARDADGATPLALLEQRLEWNREHNATKSVQEAVERDEKLRALLERFASSG